MADFKVIDGKIYKVEEVDSSQIKIEVEQSLKVVIEQENKISQLEERKARVCEPYNVEINNAKSKIAEVKSHLADKKEAIKLLLPDEYNRLGF